MTRKINIDGITFHVEPVGYEMLRAYLDAWNQGNAARKAQWEEQAAEYLLQKLRGSNTVTTTNDVKGLTDILKEVPFKIDPMAPLNRVTKPTIGRFISQLAMGLW